MFSTLTQFSQYAVEDQVPWVIAGFSAYFVCYAPILAFKFCRAFFTDRSPDL